MRTRRFKSSGDGLCWAALVTGLAVTVSAAHVVLSNWAVVVAQHVHGTLIGGWGGVVLAGR